MLFKEVNTHGNHAPDAPAHRQRPHGVLETARAARERGASVLLITCDRRSPLAAQADHLLLASNRAQRIVATDPVPSLLSSALLVEVLYYLLLTEEDL